MTKEVQIRLVSNKSVCDVESQALITAVDSKGIWCGQVDTAIRTKIGDYYHQSLLGYITQKSGLPMFEDSQVLEIKGDEENKGVFNNIIFVIDDVKKPLSEIVYNGLVHANNQNYEIISMSAIRAGEAFGRKEKTFEEMAKEVYKGIKHLLTSEENIKLKKVLLLTYDNQEYKDLLINEFGKDDAVVAIY